MRADFACFLDELIKIGSVHWTNIDFVDETEKVAFSRKKKPEDPSYDPDFDPEQSWHKQLKKGAALSSKMKRDEAYRLNVSIDRIGDKAGDPLKPLKKTAAYLQVGDQTVKLGPIDLMRAKKLWKLETKQLKLRAKGRKPEADVIVAKMKALNAKLPIDILKKPGKATKTAAPMVPFEGDVQTTAAVKPLKKIKGKGRKASIKKLVKSLGPGEGVNA